MPDDLSLNMTSVFRLAALKAHASVTNSEIFQNESRKGQRKLRQMDPHPSRKNNLRDIQLRSKTHLLFVLAEYAGYIVELS